jgi:hypothetical protein
VTVVCRLDFILRYDSILREERKMDAHELGQLHLQTGYVFENGTPFYERLGDERAAALLKALLAEGYRITPARNVSTESEHRASR